jgi:endonuclease/exonuclease/phosphatase family metal-dependent hydrolase
MRLVGRCLIGVLFLLVGDVVADAATQQTVRVVTYNIEADVNGNIAPNYGLNQVLEGIGEEPVQGNVQPLDILALQETTDNIDTVQPIVDSLNSYYGAGTYAMCPLQAATYANFPFNGNGPNALVYNAKTLNLVSTTPVDPPDGSFALGFTNGQFREVLRCEFRPVGGVPANDFYVYVSHYKSGVGTINAQDRADEATNIRNDEAANLPANARVLYVGDYNFGTTNEQTYKILTSQNSPSGIAQGQGIDPQNPPGGNGSVNYNLDFDTSANIKLLSFGPTHLQYRDDYQLMTSNVYNDEPGGLTYVQGSNHVFGNDGTAGLGPVTRTFALKDLLLRGDFNLDGQVDSTDISAMSDALSNLSAFQASHSLTNAELLAIADVNRDGNITIADTQSLTDLVNNPNDPTAPLSGPTVLSDLTYASDHLPVVSDYTVPVGVPEPCSCILLSTGGILIYRRRTLA